MGEKEESGVHGQAVRSAAKIEEEFNRRVEKESGGAL